MFATKAEVTVIPGSTSDVELRRLLGSGRHFGPAEIGEARFECAEVVERRVLWRDREPFGIVYTIVEVPGAPVERFGERLPGDDRRTL